MIPLARLGDLHVCILPGHGATPIVTASPDVIANDFLVARIGDVCACGAVIICGFPKVLVDGLPAAHLGSPTSHGGIITTGSADVFGSHKIGGGMTDTVIDFQKMGAISLEGVIDETRLFVLLGDPQLREKAIAADALIAPAIFENTPGKVCTHPDMMEALANYIADEMNRNIHHPSVLQMKELNSYSAADEPRKHFEQPFYLTIGHSPNFLFDGAGLEQIASDTVRKIQHPDIYPGPSKTKGVDGLRAWDDSPDRISIQVGVDLYKIVFPPELTGKSILDIVLGVDIAAWESAVVKHVCK